MAIWGEWLRKSLLWKKKNVTGITCYRQTCMLHYICWTFYIINPFYITLLLSVRTLDTHEIKYSNHHPPATSKMLISSMYFSVVILKPANYDSLPWRNKQSIEIGLQYQKKATRLHFGSLINQICQIFLTLWRANFPGKNIWCKWRLGCVVQWPQLFWVVLLWCTTVWGTLNT